jgi:hypothetical protein
LVNVYARRTSCSERRKEVHESLLFVEDSMKNPAFYVNIPEAAEPTWQPT